MEIQASEIAAATGGTLVGGDVTVDGATFDSRALRSGELFVALVADRDGHDFIPSAAAAGAPAYLTSRGPVGGVDATAIVVADTAVALMDAARWARTRLDVPTVAITGSVGKTSTKDLVTAVVGAQRRTTANARSFNNEQGLPVTVLGAPGDTEVLILEMGMRGFDEITRLCDVGRPTIGVVTRVGAAHAGRLGGIAGVARAKGELVEALPGDGVAVLNADDELVAAMSARTAADVLTYGEAAGADVRLTDVALDELARAELTVATPWGEVSTRLAVSGRHMASNAAAAIAVAGVLGLDVAAAAEALATATIVDGRMTVHRLPSGAVVVDDAYNANPTSVIAALDALAAISADRRVAVLGVMAELDDPAAGHAAVAAAAERLGIEVIAVNTDLYGVAPTDDPAHALVPLGAGDAVLVKGSLVAGLQALAARLVAAG